MSYNLPNYFDYFTVKENTITHYIKDNKKIKLEAYEKIIHEILLNKFKQFKSKTNLKFLYSKGIDSLVILSYLIKLNLINKVELFSFKNNHTKQNDKIFTYEKQLGININVFNIDENTIIDAINSENYYNVFCYSTYKVFNKFKNSNIIYGFHGNQSLLHKDIFLHQIKKDPSEIGYCKSLENFKLDFNNIIPIEYHNLIIRPWKKLNGIHNNTLLDPLGDNEIFDLVRNLEWSSIDPNYVVNACLARKLIKLNVGTLFDCLIKEENLNESDKINHSQLIDLNKIKDTIINIPQSSRHNTEGLGYIKTKVKEAIHRRVISLETVILLLSIKTLIRN
jgi:hypothetical protein